MLESEAKYPAADFAALERQLAGWGAAADADRRDADHYYNAPDRDFAQTDEALRLRRIGPANFVTYKGPRRDTQTKTRTEIEVGLADGDEAAAGFDRLLRSLGYRPVAVVTKRRRTFHLQREGYELQVCLDAVDEVGRFVELEIVAPEADYEPAKAVLLRAAEELGLGATERRSYLEMLLRARNG
jgi:adenylate cyclase class 2